VATSTKKSTAAKATSAPKAGKSSAAAGKALKNATSAKPAAKPGKPLAKPTAPTAGPAKPGAPKPAPPRLTVRTPPDVDERKQKLGALVTATQQIKALKRSLQKSFYEIGLILRDIDTRKLYEVKGYGTFEAFLEREIELGKQMGLRLARTVQVFQREAALEAGLERVSAAIAVLDGEVDPAAPPPGASPTSTGGARSPIPFHKQ
jgi:hypothetical protein